MPLGLSRREKSFDYILIFYIGKNSIILEKFQKSPKIDVSELNMEKFPTKFPEV